MEIDKNELTPELIEQAKKCKTAAELAALAKKNRIDLTEAEAEEYLAELETAVMPFEGEISDDEMGVVAGGTNDQDHKYPINTCVVQFEEGKVYNDCKVYVNHVGYCSGYDKFKRGILK